MSLHTPSLIQLLKEEVAMPGLGSSGTVTIVFTFPAVLDKSIKRLLEEAPHFKPDTLASLIVGKPIEVGEGPIFMATFSKGSE